MKLLIHSTRFLRDKKRMAKRRVDFRKLRAVLVRLQCNEPLPTSTRPHKLGGEWDGFWECHIEPDWLLIYDKSGNVITGNLTLIRTGTHSELF